MFYEYFGGKKKGREQIIYVHKYICIYISRPRKYKTNASIKRVNPKVLINKPRANRVVSEARGKKGGRTREIGRGQTSTARRRKTVEDVARTKGKGTWDCASSRRKGGRKEGSAAVVRK